MSKQTYRICCCFRRRFKLGEAEPPVGIGDLFGRYSENGFMTADGLGRFVREVQGEAEFSDKEAEAAIDAILKELKHLPIFQLKHLDLGSFFRYLFSSDLNPPLPPLRKVHHDMTAPLAHYFIYTGHNSYLTGNQLSSACSNIPIIDALRRGVRVIELDVWPNSAKDGVDVVHGGTLTSPVDLIKCLRSIEEHAFVASEYPVIITLEDHLTPDLQAKVAKMVTETFGDALFFSGSESITEFPSPESLKRRIILSTKPPKEYLESKSIKERDDSLPNVKERDNGLLKIKNSPEEDVWGAELSGADKLEAFDENEQQDINYKEEDEHKDTDPTLQQNAAPEYKHLIAIQARKLKGEIKDWLHVDPMAVTRISLREQRLEKAVVSHATEVVRFTQTNLLRVFPKGIRFDSSNYNPLIGWTHGAQMVAFNMQGHGRSLWLMQGMFRANGGCGYVKKPDFLLRDGANGEVFDPKKSTFVKKTVKVKVYMGNGWHLDFHRTHFDIYSPPDFYAKVGIAGVPADSVMKKTRTLQDNWIPAWEEEFEFPLTVPELALLRIEVHEYDMSEKDDFGGQTCLPVSELRTGIRSIPLHDQKGDQYKSVKLLMQFEFV